MFLKTISAAVVAVGLSAAGALAAQFTYTVSGTGSGSIDGNAFTDTAFSFTLEADDANFTESGNLQIFNPLDSFAFDIGGTVGTVSIGTRLGFNDSVDAIFIGRSPGNDLFDFFVSDGFDLDSEFTVAGTGVFALGQFQNVATTAGLLSFDASSDVVFSSVSDTAVVPLPAGLPLLAGALALFGVFRRKAT